MDDKEVLDLLKKGISLNNIAFMMDNNPFEAYQSVLRLKREGYLLEEIYLDNGNVLYKTLYSPKTIYNHTANLTLTDSSRFTCLVISDIHFGNIKQNLKYLDMVYNLCSSLNTHVIINTGDLIDGTFSKEEQLTNDVRKQINGIIEAHPYDRRILNFLCFGNHDYTAYEEGYDMREVLNNSRHDLITVGFGLGILNLNHGDILDQIILRHEINSLPFKDTPGKFILHGHLHKNSVEIKPDRVLVNVPSLSDMQPYNGFMPGFIKLDISLTEKGMEDIIISNFSIINDHIYITGETYIDSIIRSEPINEDEVIEKRLLKKQEQIDKFKQRMKKHLELVEKTKAK